MIHLVTGGSGSGKSAYAEQCILDFGGTRRVYIATMQPFGAEGQARIARHRKMRAAKQFSTIECYTNLKEVELEPGSDVLLECMSNLVANEMYMESGAGRQMKYLIHPGREKRGRRRKFLRAFPVWPIRRGIWFW